MTGRAGRFLIAPALIAALAPRTAPAQAIRPLLGTPRAEAGPVLTSTPNGTSLSPRHDQIAGSSAMSRRAFTTSVSVVGGAALGAWFGFFMSQVVKSDWEGERTADRADHRRRFAISGAALGALSGYLIRPRARRSRPEPPRFYVYVAPTDRHYITRQELRRTIALSALEAVQLLRPEWLANGQFAGSATAGGSPTVAAQSTIAVYVVDTRIGGPEALADVSIPEIEELRRYEPREAARRWGIEHPHGAIEVVPGASAATK